MNSDSVDVEGVPADSDLLSNKVELDPLPRHWKGLQCTEECSEVRLR